jgi:hypothetical protein
LRPRLCPRRWPCDLSVRRDCLCANVRDLRSVARSEAVTSAEGGSPNMKNLIKAASIRTTESCPIMKPWVKDRLDSRVSRASRLGM